jgi:hypothetical protein
MFSGLLGRWLRMTRIEQSKLIQVSDFHSGELLDLDIGRGSFSSVLK